MSFTHKILIILTPGFPADEADITCLPAQQRFIQILQQNFPGRNMIIVTVQYPAVSKEYHWNNVKVISLGIQKGFYKRFAWMKIWNTLKQLRRENEIAGLLCFWCTEHSLPAFWFARTYHLPHYCWILGQDAKKNNHVVKLIRPRASELIALSDSLADEFYKNYRITPRYVIPMGVDGNLSHENHTDRFLDLIGAGSLIPLKQYELFLETVKYLTRSYPELKAVICGSGPEKCLLQSKIKELQIERNLKLAGELPHDELIAIMHHAKIFLHPSSYEGFSSACLEALSAGAHVISFHKPMHKEIPHWHQVNNIEEMKTQTMSLLEEDSLPNEPGIPFSMQDASQKILSLFGNQFVSSSIFST